MTSGSASRKGTIAGRGSSTEQLGPRLPFGLGRRAVGEAGRSETSTAPSGALRRATTRSRRGTSPNPFAATLDADTGLPGGDTRLPVLAPPPGHPSFSRLSRAGAVAAHTRRRGASALDVGSSAPRGGRRGARRGRRRGARRRASSCAYRSPPEPSGRAAGTRASRVGARREVASARARSPLALAAFARPGRRGVAVAGLGVDERERADSRRGLRRRGARGRRARERTKPRKSSGVVACAVATRLRQRPCRRGGLGACRGHGVARVVRGTGVYAGCRRES